MKTYILILIILAGMVVHAQAPGYVGKKLSIIYDPNISVALYDNFGVENDIPVLGLNYRHDLNIEYVISRGMSLGVTAKFTSVKMYDVSQIVDEVYNPEIDDYQYVGFNGDISDKVTCIGVTAKNFSFRKRGAIAPVGRYKSFELIVAFQKLSTARLKDYGRYSGSDTKEGKAFLELIAFEDIHANTRIDLKPTVFAILGGGKQSVAGDAIVLNFGWEFGLSLSDHLFNMIGVRSGYEISSPDTYADIAGDRIAGAFFLNFNIGIGYLVL
ncbi:MAG: hypothetical protein H7X71_03210 [Chitinophagales bacterium]|nr:hypothetical protein [Chitinophagales bacterium]